MRDCDLIHDEHSQDANNRAVFNCVKLEYATMRDFRFENLRIGGQPILTLPAAGFHVRGEMSNLVFE